MVIGLDFAKKYGKLRYGIIFNVTKVISCGTKYLGFKRYSCRDCNRNKSVAFSCKGRFCSRCGKKQTDQWVSKASNVLPPKHDGSTLHLQCRTLYGRYFGSIVICLD
ncbi:transposase zinc-binding domain-containing protein [Candidatus Megaera polyxenophila]|uniref:transposase zinc-binding domain-containing protein n=1 Tax=Candidatus Megaera polyxenophila TaxID=988779 RepID=UPI00249ED97D|nr:transposase zinc-binding domain-containing protein [Candidatus Megaera polyxenophila]